MAIHRPVSISQANGLAKLIETKLKETKPKYPKPFQQNTSRPTFHSSYQTPPKHTPTPPSTPAQTHKPTPPHNKLPVKKLTQAQMQERRAQGLCFNCDEKFFAGHKCTTNRFLLLLVEDNPNENELTEENHQTLEEEYVITDEANTYFQLSPQALTGQFSPQILKFKGQIGSLIVMVLVDTGSTHSILQPRIARHLDLPTSATQTFSVMVGNGSHIHCQGICKNVPINLQNHLFCLPFYLLPIEGADVALGMDWLRTLGSIQADFSIPSITFSHNDQPITLTGEQKTTPT